MTWKAPVLAVSLTSSVALALVYWYLFTQHRTSCLRTWALGWTTYAVGFAVSLAVSGAPESDLLLLGNQVPAFISGLLLLWGTYAFMGRSARIKWWGIGTALGFGWMVVAVLADLPFFLLTLPTFFFLGFVYICTGIALLRLSQPSGIGTRVTGWAFVIWGLHKADFPFVYPIAWLAPWRYLLGATLGLTVAVGILLAYFQKAQEDWRESEEKYRSLVEQSGDPIYLLHDDRFEIINPKFEDLFGTTPEEASAPDFDFMTLVAPKSRPLIKERSKKLADGQELSPRYEFTALDKDGNEIDVDASVSYVPYRGGTATQGILRDITARKRAEEDLRLHREQLEEMVVERTAELRKIVDLMVGREVRMAELKEVVRKLRTQLEAAGLEPIADDPLLEGSG
jgi:PAS domain S-box-containing protein